MKKVTDSPSCGILVGRFQVHDLHDAHIDLINTVCKEHEKVIIFLGLSPLMVTQNNPLDFESRKQMILEKFPNVNVLYIKDTPDDEVWSKDLDEKIKDLVSPNQGVILYGSRDSFISHYSGQYKTQELMQEVYISGAEIRKNISKKVKSSADFRAGVIWASGNRYPTTYPTVDIAIFNEDCSKILLGRKAKESKYRFIGGFADPKSDSYEDDAIREVKEETGLDIVDLMYVGSFRVQDWRYRSEIDKIKTLLFCAKMLEGRPQAMDDIAEVRLFDFDKIDPDTMLVTEHARMFKTLKQYWMDYLVFKTSEDTP